MRAERARDRPVPARRTRRFSMRRTNRFVARPAAAAARGLRALRAGLHAADLPWQRRLHARARRPTTTCWSPHAENFSWRDGHLRDLIPLLGDGLLTIDGEFHRRSPQDHAAGVPPRADRQDARRDGRRGRARARRRWRAGDASSTSTAGRAALALRIAHARAVRPRPRRAQRRRLTRPHEFEQALVASSRATTLLQMLRGPGTPFDALMLRSRARLDALIFAEIDRRRRDRRARRGHPLAAARRHRRGRRRRCRAATSATRS